MQVPPNPPVPTRPLKRPNPFEDPKTTPSIVYITAKDALTYLENLTGFNCDPRLHTQITAAIAYWNEVKASNRWIHLERMRACSKIIELADKVLAQPKVLLKLAEGEFPINAVVLRQLSTHSETIRSKLERWEKIQNSVPVIDFSEDPHFPVTSNGIEEILKLLKDPAYRLPEELFFEVYFCADALAIEPLKDMLEQKCANNLSTQSPFKCAFDYYEQVGSKLTISSDKLKVFALVRMAEFLTDKSYKDAWSYSDGRLQVPSLDINWKDPELHSFLEACKAINDPCKKGISIYRHVSSLPKAIDLYLTHLFHFARSEWNESNKLLRQFVEMFPGIMSLELRFCQAINKQLTLGIDVSTDDISKVEGIYKSGLCIPNDVGIDFLENIFIFISIKENNLPSQMIFELTGQDWVPPVYKKLNRLIFEFTTPFYEILQSFFEEVFASDNTNLPALILLEKFLRRNINIRVSEKIMTWLYFANKHGGPQLTDKIFDFLQRHHPYTMKIYNEINQKDNRAQLQQGN